METSIIYAIVGTLIGVAGAGIGTFVSIKKAPKKRKEILIMAASIFVIVLVHCCIQILISAPWKVYAAIVYSIVTIAFIIYWTKRASQPGWSDSATGE